MELEAAQNLRMRARMLYRSGKLDDAILAQIELVNATRTSSVLADFKLLSLMLFSTGDYPSSVTILRDTLERWPDDLETMKNLGVCLLKVGQLAESRTWLERAVENDANDVNLLDALASLHTRLGSYEIARRHGERALMLKDSALADNRETTPVEYRPIPPFAPDAPERNIIAFSLWGAKERYVSGAVANAQLAAELYPGWRCRFYCDDTVPAHVRAELLNEGADVVMMRRPRRLFEGLFWRFLVAEEDGIDRFLIRDADSVVSLRERDAVMEWLASDRHFHVIRDYLSHTELILAGLWGGVGATLPGIISQVDPYLDAVTKTPTCDQKFLRERIWPLIRGHCLIHDSNFRVLGERDFPRFARARPGRHVGQNRSGLKPTMCGTVFEGTFGSPPRAKQPRKAFLFTITAGRTGTVYLAELLKRNLTDAEIHHERLGFANLGVHSPDASHFTLFNSVGNVAEVRKFWRRKLAAIRYGESNRYVEVSHFLSKAGLLENLGVLGISTRIDVIVLTRDTLSVAKSIANRFDFANSGFTWLFALDPRYPRKIVPSQPFTPHGMLGACVWYVLEMQARAVYYRSLLTEQANIVFHEVALQQIVTRHGAVRLLAILGGEACADSIDLPPPRNATESWILDERARLKLAEIVDGLSVDPAELARDFFASGRRLG